MRRKWILFPRLLLRIENLARTEHRKSKQLDHGRNPLHTHSSLSPKQQIKSTINRHSLFADSRTDQCEYPLNCAHERDILLSRIFVLCQSSFGFCARTAQLFTSSALRLHFTLLLLAHTHTRTAPALTYYIDSVFAFHMNIVSGIDRNNSTGGYPMREVEEVSDFEFQVLVHCSVQRMALALHLLLVRRRWAKNVQPFLLIKNRINQFENEW